jgi:hypothetical protein
VSGAYMRAWGRRYLQEEVKVVGGGGVLPIKCRCMPDHSASSFCAMFAAVVPGHALRAHSPDTWVPAHNECGCGANTKTGPCNLPGLPAARQVIDTQRKVVVRGAPRLKTGSVEGIQYDAQPG